MWKYIAVLLLAPLHALALESQFLTQSSAVTADPSNELQPAGLARLRPGQRFAVTAQSIGDSKYEIEGYSNFPLTSGGPRLIPGSVASARSGRSNPHPIPATRSAWLTEARRTGVSTGSRDLFTSSTNPNGTA